MKLVIIAGDAAVGKMSVGQELARQTDLRLFHNHITIEPVIEVFGYYDSKIINKLRWIFFEEFAWSQLDGMIFTCMIDFNNPNEFIYIDKIKHIFEDILDQKGEPFEFYFVELNADQKVRLHRNSTENRLKAKPSKRDIEKSNQRLIEDDKIARFISHKGEIPYSNYIRIVNDNLSIEEQVKLIRKNFNI